MPVPHPLGKAAKPIRLPLVSDALRPLVVDVDVVDGELVPHVRCRQQSGGYRCQRLFPFGGPPPLRDASIRMVIPNEATVRVRAGRTLRDPAACGAATSL